MKMGVETDQSHVNAYGPGSWKSKKEEDHKFAVVKTQINS